MTEDGRRTARKIDAVSIVVYPVFGVASAVLVIVYWFSPSMLAICVFASTQTVTSAMRWRGSRMTGRLINISVVLLIALAAIVVSVAVAGHLVPGVDGDDATGATVVAVADVALTVTWVAILRWAMRHQLKVSTAPSA